jgi:hypothetical protein
MNHYECSWTINGDTSWRKKAALALSEAEMTWPEISRFNKYLIQSEYTLGLPRCDYDQDTNCLHAMIDEPTPQNIKLMSDIPLERRATLQQFQPHIHAITERIHQIGTALHQKKDQTVVQTKFQTVDNLFIGYLYSFYDEKKSRQIGVFDLEISKFMETSFQRLMAAAPTPTDAKLVLSKLMAGITETINLDHFLGGPGQTRLMYLTYQAVKDFLEKDTSGLVDRIAIGLWTTEAGSFGSVNGTAVSLFKP